MLARYAEVLGAPGAARLVVLGLLARLTTAVIGLPLILLGVQATGSYAGGGAATAAFGVGVAAAAPLRGRWLDRHGARRAMPPLLAVHCAALVLAAVSGALELGLALIAVSFVTGAVVPSLPAAMRLEWQRILGEGDPRLERAYAFEATAQVSLFVVGPVLAGAGVTVIGAAPTIAACAVLVGTAGTAFAFAAGRPDSGARGTGSWLGPIALPGVQTLVVAVLISDVSLGALEVGVVAFAGDRDHPGLAGPLLALYAVSSALGAAALGAVEWRRAPARELATRCARAASALAAPPVRLAVLLAVAGVLTVPLVPASGFGALAVLLLLAGIPVAAIFATATIVLDAVAPADGAAEAYNWLSAANATGVAGGSLLGGVLVDTSGPAAAFTAGAVSLGLAAAGVGLRRAALRHR